MDDRIDICYCLAFTLTIYGISTDFYSRNVICKVPYEINNVYTNVIYVCNV